MNGKLLRELPKTDLLAERVRQTEEGKRYTDQIRTRAVRGVLDTLRSQILDGKRTELPKEEILLDMVLCSCKELCGRSLVPVINATGVSLHTNLGRSILSHEAADAAKEVAEQYSTLEYDRKNGKRGSRHSHVERLLTELCGCEAAMVVNNNAAAVLLMLSAMAKGKKVVISRGELIEIGGSFRIPEIMELGGAILKEVGTTNRTKLRDYQKAMDEDTAAFLKVHTSNFRIEGFTEEVDLADLVKEGHALGIPVLYDMGSGALVDMKLLADTKEPNAREVMRLGVDVACFSGDKLLGGPQAGILIGKEEYIRAMKEHPFARALRVDKMTLAALETTLLHYRKGEAWTKIPVLRMLKKTKEEGDNAYALLCSKIEELPEKVRDQISFEKIEEAAPAGGGSLPGVLFPTVCMGLRVKGMSAAKVESFFRNSDPSVIGRIKEDCFILDLRTISEEDMNGICRALFRIS